MALSYRTRRRLSLLILLVGLPLYIVVAVSLVNGAEARWGQLPAWAELPLYVVLAVGWIFPLKPIFKGVGQPDPDRK